MALEPRIVIVGRTDNATQIAVRFDTEEFDVADVQRAAEAIVKDYLSKTKLLFVTFDHRGRASGFAYPARSGEGLYIPPAVSLTRNGGRWPFRSYAQMMAREGSATVWFRSGDVTKQWNIVGRGDSSYIAAGTRLQSVHIPARTQNSALATAAAYVRTDAVPTDELCRGIARQFLREWSVPSIFVAVRNDHWFGGEGPVMNPFASDWLRPPTFDEIKQRKEWSCWLPSKRQ